MPNVKLNLLNIFSLRLGKNHVQYEGETVKNVITQFVKEYGDKLDDGLLSKRKNKLHENILILVNGRSIENMKGYKTKLNEGDEMFLSIPLSGG